MEKDFNTYQLKITLGLDKNTYRVIKICGTDTLDDLSNAILSSIDFTDDHLYLFNMDNVKYSENCYNRMPEYDENSTDIPIDDLSLVGKQKFLYLYDFGDEWVFKILVQKIEKEEKYKKPVVMEAVGEIEQYPDYDEEYEAEVSLQLIGDLKIIDILNHIGEEYLQEEYLSLFDYQRTIQGKHPDEMRNEIMEEILSHPERLVLFLPNKQLEYLDAFVHNENIFSVRDRCELMKLYSFGFCRINEYDDGFTIEIPKQVTDVYRPYMTDTKNKKTADQNMELQKIAEYLLSKYGVIELDNLFEILCFITNRKIEYEDFKYFAYSRLHYLGNFIIFEGEDSIQYLSLFKKEDALKILEQRNSSDEYKKLSYPVFTLQHCREAINQNYYLEYPAYKEWWEYVNFDITCDIDSCNRLMEITAFAALTQVEEDAKLMKECREIFHRNGFNFTRKAQRLIRALWDGMPAAVEKGRTFDEYGRTGMIREGMYNSMEEAELDRTLKGETKKEKGEEIAKKDEKAVYDQLSLF